MAEPAAASPAPSSAPPPPESLGEEISVPTKRGPTANGASSTNPPSYAPQQRGANPDDFLGGGGGGGSGSGDSPPPPERKYSSDATQSPGVPQAGTPGRRERPTKFHFYVPQTSGPRMMPQQTQEGGMAMEQPPMEGDLNNSGQWGSNRSGTGGGGAHSRRGSNASRTSQLSREKGIDPPEKELPTYLSAGHTMTSAEVAARKAQSRLIALQHRESRATGPHPTSASSHPPTMLSVPTGAPLEGGNDSGLPEMARPIRRRTRSGGSLDMLSSIADRNSDSEEDDDHHNKMGGGMNDIDGDDDDDDYPNVSTDPVESDDEGGAFDDAGPPAANVGMMHPQQQRGGQPLRYGSPQQQNRRNDALNYMKQHPSSAPQHGGRRMLPPQQLMQYLHAGRGTFGGNNGNGNGRPNGGLQGMGVAPPPFGRGGGGMGMAPQQQPMQQGTKGPHMQPQHLPRQGHGGGPGMQGAHLRRSAGPGGGAQPPQQQPAGGKARSFHEQRQPPQQGGRNSKSFHGHQQQSQHQPQQQQREHPQQRGNQRMTRRGSNHSQHSHHSNAPSQQQQQQQHPRYADADEADAAGMGPLPSPRKAPPPPPPQQGQMARPHRPPPKMDNDGTWRQQPQHQQQQHQQQHGSNPQRIHRPPPPRQPLSGTATPTRPGTRPANITAAAAVDYVMSAGARSPYDDLGGDEASSLGGGTDPDTLGRDLAAAVGNRPDLTEDDADIEKMNNYLSAIMNIDGAGDDEEGAVVEGINNRTSVRRRTSLDDDDVERDARDGAASLSSDGSGTVDDDDFERGTSLSMHAEAKAGPSRHAEDKRGAAAAGARTDIPLDDSMGRPGRGAEHPPQQYHLARQGSLDPPAAAAGLAPSVLPMRTMHERLYAVEAVIPTPTRYGDDHDDDFADEGGGGSFDGTMPRLASQEGEGGGMAPSTYHPALGPRSKRPGGITGVVLDAGPPAPAGRGRGRPSMTDDSSSEGSARGDGDDGRGSGRRAAHPEGQLEGVTRSWSGDGGGADPPSTALMMKLCAHLLPVGLNSSLSSLFQDKRNSLTWDDDDPDEPGYVVHRLNSSQLVAVESAFENLVQTLERSSEKQVRDNDKNFERDLEEAEMILDREEKRYESEAGKPMNAAERDARPEVEAKRLDNETSRQSVPDFPGIYPPGQGKPGEMECFYLPIITKSQKTGFEPTKDLVLKSGSVFANNYLVQSELGSAAFSTAYRCLDLSSEEDEDGYQDEVCLKVIKNTKDYFDQSLDEIKILQLLKDTGRVQDNNIVEMKSFFYHREHLVIVTELLRQNLYEFGKSILESRGPLYFTRHRLSHITRQCLVALKFVHELGLMHCDIKPENILLSSYSRALVKVIDFGSSSFVTDRQSSYIQSRSYRAPEVILGLPYGGKIDMWSLGCVVAEMYTNEVTFQNDSELSMLSRIEAVCGTFPRHMIAKGRNSHRIFTDSGLIYEKVASDEDEDRSHGSRSDDDDDTDKTVYSVYQPKMTTVAARLGFDEDFMDQPNLSEDDKKRALFIDFVSKLLTIDPDARPSASEALNHPWITSSLDLTEEDIRYGQ